MSHAAPTATAPTAGAHDVPRLRPPPVAAAARCTRDAAIIALLVRGLRLRLQPGALLRRQADDLLPAARHRADPADRAADDARSSSPARSTCRWRASSACAASLIGVLIHDHGWSDARPPRSSRSWSGCLAGALNGFLVAVRRAARRSRSPSARWRSTAASRSGCSAPRRSPASRSAGRDLANKHDRRPRSYPADRDPVRRPRRRRSRSLLHFTPFGRGVYEIGLNAEAAHVLAASTYAGRKFAALRRSAASVSALRRRLLHAALRQRPRRQRHRPRAPGDRGRAARRRLHLRRPRRPARRHRRRPPDRRAVQRPAPRSRHGADVINIVIGVLLVALGDLDPAAWTRLRALRVRDQKDRAVRPARRDQSATSPRKVTVMKWKSKRFAATAARGPDGEPGSRRLRQRFQQHPRRVRRRLQRERRRVTSRSPSSRRTSATPTSTPARPASRRRSSAHRRHATRRSAPQTATPDGQVPYINTATQQGTKAIVISANDPTALCDALKQAHGGRHQGRHLRLRHQPRAAATCSSTRPTADGIAKVAGRHDRQGRSATPARSRSCRRRPTPPTRTPGSTR